MGASHRAALRRDRRGPMHGIAGDAMRSKRMISDRVRHCNRVTARRGGRCAGSFFGESGELGPAVVADQGR